MNVLDLFSGIGGFSLGLERAGMRTVAFCEIDPFCRRVLAQHWPDVPVWGDIKTLTAEWLVANAESEPGRIAASGSRTEGSRTNGSKQFPSDCGVDVICGGFPCQDISVAGKGAGIEGARSGLWSEYARVIGEVRPRYVIVENVAALLGRGLERVLGDLAALGFDAEWHCIPASAVGAPHRRDRVWIVAHAAGEQFDRPKLRGEWRPEFADCGAVANANGGHKYWRCSPVQMGWGWRAGKIADDGEFGRTQWGTEPDVGRVAHGVPARVDRLRSLGNAVVPQIPEIIGRAIMNVEKLCHAN